MSWTLAHNLRVRHDAIESCWPGTVIGEVGDPKHQAEASDHNPDSRGVVHAIDAMTYSDETKAKAILAWCLSSTADLQYVIHDDRIYGRNEVNGWKGAPYQPNNPNRDRHTDHVHISGKHGATGKNSATGTGYDTTAEASTPAGSPCSTTEDDMALTKDDMHTLLTTPVFPYAAPKVSLGTTWLGTSNTVTQILAAVAKMADPQAIAAAIVAKLPTSGLTQEQVTAGVKAALDDITLTVSADDTPAAP